MFKSFLHRVLLVLARTMNIISLCKFPRELPLVGFVPWLHGSSSASSPAPSPAHLRDILLSKTNDFHLIYFHCSPSLVAAKGFS